MACGGAATPSPERSAPTVPSAPAASQPAAATAGACADSTDPATVDVEIAGNAFSPRTVQAAVGDVIAWTNADQAAHSAVVGDAGCATDTLAQGEAGALVFTAPGTYDYVCGIHPRMTGTIEVSG
jgi:plastocyanin